MRWLGILLCVLGCGRVNFDARDGDALDPPVGEPEAWWRCEDALSDGAADSSAFGHDATCGPACPTLAPGHVGNACDFTVGAYLRVPDDGRFRDDTALTIACWMRTRAPQVNQAVVSKPYQSGNINSWQLEITPPTNACSTAGTMNCAPNLVMGNAWQHYATTFDGTLKRLYVDGVEVLAVGDQLRLDSQDVVLGADYELDGAGNFVRAVIHLDGLLDEVLIYDRVLSQSEIAVLAAQ